MKERASSLVTTLMVIVVLTVIVVAFMQSMSIERMTSRSYANKYQAELLADAATEDAANRILTAIEPFPYSAAYYAATVAGTNSTHLYLARYTNQTSVLGTARVPLFSTIYTNFSAFTNLAQAPIETSEVSVTNRNDANTVVTTTFSAANDVYVNMNQSNSYAVAGIVGLTNSTGPVSMPVNWIYQTNAMGKVIGRYAYWVDDETSKIDLRTAGNIARRDGTNAEEVSLSAFASLGMTTDQMPAMLGYKTQASPIKVPSQVRYPTNQPTTISDAQWSRIRPYLTQYSLNDLRSPDGNLSLNLNELVTTTTNSNRIRYEVETIATAITNNLPDFGKRYYQATGPSASASPATPSADDQLIYVKKIAANIRDYIDADDTATVILDDGSAYIGTAPDFIPYETIIDEVPIIGKEKGPYLNEYALVTRVISPNPEVTTSSSSAAVTITIRYGHYIELFNPTSQPIEFNQLGPNPRVIIANQTTWINKKDNSIFRPADVQLSLPSNFSIPASGYAVLTTDGPPFTTATSNQTGYLGSSANRYTLTRGAGPGKWSLLGTPGQAAMAGGDYEDYQIATENLSTYRYNLQMNNGITGSYDYCRERLLFVNDNGIIDYTLRIYSVGNYYLGRYTRNPTTSSTFVADGFTSSNNANPETSSTTRLNRGDPRANGEISELAANTSCSWKSGNSPSYGDNIADLQMTLGANNYEWEVSTGTSDIAVQAWAEYSLTAGNNYIANTNVASIGELGFIYDPARYSISQYRSYGRTLRMGQPDLPNFNRNANSLSAADTNWIGGLGTGSTTSTNYLRNAYLLANVFRADNSTNGKVNPNGIFRSDDQTLLAALFNGYKFATNGAFQASGTLSGSSINTNALYKAMTSEFVAGRPIIGVGDLSRLETFGTKTNADSIANVDMSSSTVSDGDREQAFRRTAGLISTQSLSYSIYVIGQSGKVVNNKFRPSSTVKKNTIVQFQPTYSSTNFPAKPSSWKTLKPWQINYN